MSIKSDLKYYFEHNANEKVYLADILLQEQFKEVESRTLQSTITMLIAKEDYPLTVVDRGQCWIYAPNASKYNPELVIIDETPTRIIFKDRTDELWIAKKLDL